MLNFFVYMAYCQVFIILTFFTVSILNNNIGSVTPSESARMINKVSTPSCTVLVSTSASVWYMNFNSPSIVLYAREPGTMGITDGILITVGGTCRQWEKGKLINPAADAPASEANIIPPVTSGSIMVNFKNPATKALRNIGSNPLDGVLKSTANPSAAMPHQKALNNMLSHSPTIEH
jgi:hypothetical protein